MNGCPMAIKRYAVVGVGGRGTGMFALPLANEAIRTGKTVDVQKFLGV